MRSVVAIEIDGEVTEFSTVWVHLKRRFRMKTVPFSVTVHWSQVRAIFDPYDRKPAAESWSQFIRNDIDSLGTFIVDAYFKAMARATGDEETRWEWVIASVDEIVEDVDGIELSGQAEPFDLAMF